MVCFKGGQIGARSDVGLAVALTLVLGGLVPPGTAAWAADAPSASAETAASGGTEQLEEIVISARKTTEDLQRAAISVKVLAGDTFVNAGIKDTTQLQSRLPAVEFESSQVPSVIIRGVGTYNNQDNVDSAVAYSYDGAYISHVFGLPPVIFDLERVEAALGPQGTLQGRNSNGGLISFVTNKPKQELEASAALTEGNYGTVGTDLMLNLPLSSNTALRAAFASDRHSGYLANGYNDAHNYGARVKLLSTPIDKLELITTVDYSLTNGKGQQFSQCPPRTDVAACAAIGWHPWAGLSGTQPEQPDDIFRTTNFGVYQEINYNFDWATLSSLSNYRRYDSHDISTFGPLFYSPNQIDKFYTQEIRLASMAASYLKWVGGIYYSHERLDAVDTYNYFGAPYLNFVIPGSEAKSKAVFGQVTVPIIDKLSFTGGLRYTEDYKSSFGLGTAYGADGATTVPTGGIEQLKKLTWKAGIDYQLTDDNLLYGIASNGFKSGGVNQVPVASGVPASYGPETVKAYQLGSKNRFWNERAQINSEVFYYDYRGYQVYVSNSDPTGAFPGSFFSTANSQKATFYGGEIQSVFALTSQDRLEVNLTLLHAKFDTFVVGVFDYSGNHVQGSPAYTLGSTLEHTFELPDAHGTVLLSGTTKLVDGHYVDISNAPGSFQKTYTRTDARLSWSDAKKKYSVSAFVRNLEGSAILQVYGGLLGPPGDLAYVYPPRTFGITISANLK